MKNYPKISIVTPSYNQGRFLEVTIQSVLDQNYPDLEYIIIDGGSTDNSVDIIKKYEKHLSYWISEKDDGQADAINKGIRRSTGEIIGWLNSDDTYVKGAFLKVIGAFKKNPDCIVVHGDRILIDADNHVVGWTALPPFNPQCYGFNVCSETAFWRRNAMDKIGLLNASLRFAMDLEFFSRLYQVGLFCKIDDYLGCFRCHPDNKSSTIWSVGQTEAEREWKRLFGAENENWSVGPPSSEVRHKLAFLRCLKLLGIPYIQYRLQLLKRRSGDKHK